MNTVRCLFVSRAGGLPRIVLPPKTLRVSYTQRLVRYVGLLNKASERIRLWLTLGKGQFLQGSEHVEAGLKWLGCATVLAIAH